LAVRPKGRRHSRGGYQTACYKNTSQRCFYKAVGIISILVLGLGACSSSQQNLPRHSEAATAGLSKTRPDPLSERRIVMLHPSSGERLDVVYYRKGAYVPEALKKINYLFRDRHRDVTGTIDPELIDYLVDLRTRLSLPPTIVFDILSGYRTASTNHDLARSNRNVAKESLHIHGWAVDFRMENVNGRAIAEIAKTMQRGGVSYYPSDNHLHVDLGNIRTWHGN
jgi:uncharacterized protein YcbK (DUF882 family)